MSVQILRCEQNPIGLLEHGIGFNWYDGFGSPEFQDYLRQKEYPEPEERTIYPGLDDRAGWNAVMEALDDLRPGLIRFGLPTPFDEHTGQFRKDTVHFKRLEIVAHWAERSGCSILLDTFFIPKPYQFPMSPEVARAQKWADMAAADNAAYARQFVAPLLRHVIDDLGLKAVKLFNAYNEPFIYGPYQTPNNQPDAYVHYVDMYRELRKALTEAGLCPDKIKLAGIDCVHADTFSAQDMLAQGVDIDPFLDCYTIHYYFHRLDWMAPVPFLPHTLQESMDRQSARIRRYCSLRGKPLLAAELGWFPMDGDPPHDPLGSSRHLAALINAEAMIRGMNIGLSGFALWSLFNPCHYDGHWRVVAVRNGTLWKAPHLYPVYRLFTRYARPGSQILPIASESPERPWQYVHATALRRPDGKLALFAVNDHLVETRAVRFLLPEEWAGPSRNTSRMKSGPGTVWARRHRCLKREPRASRIG